MHFPYKFIVKQEPAAGPVPYGALRAKPKPTPEPTSDFDPAELARRLEIHQLIVKREQKERLQRRQQRAEKRAAEAKRISIQIPEDHGSRRSSRIIITSADLGGGPSGRRRVSSRPSLTRSSSMSSRASFLTRRRRMKAWPGPRPQDNSRQVVPEATMFNNIQIDHLGRSISRQSNIHTNETFLARPRPISVAGNRNSIVMLPRDGSQPIVNINNPILTRSTGEKERRGAGANGKEKTHAGTRETRSTSKAEKRERTEREKGPPTEISPSKTPPSKTLTPRRIKSAEVLGSAKRLEPTREESEPAETRPVTRSLSSHQEQEDRGTNATPPLPIGVPISPKDRLALKLHTKPRSKSCGNLPQQTNEDMERRLSDDKTDKSAPLRKSRWARFAEMNFFNRKEASRIKAGSKTPAKSPPKTPSKTHFPDGEGKPAISRQKSLLMLFRKDPS